MRAFVGILAIAFIASVALVADVRDLGVPAGWRASDYDRRGYDLLNKGDYENARRYLDAAIRTDPYFWTAYYNRATTFCQQKKWAAALQDLNSTVRLKPAFFEASFLRAAISRQLGNYGAGLTDINTLIRLAFRVGNVADQSHALNERAWLRSVCPDPSMRSGQLAIADAKKACELMKWKRAEHIDTLAAAYAEAGDFDSAIHYEEQAISVSKSEPEELSKLLAEKTSERTAMELAKKAATELGPLRQQFSQRLELYKQHRPYRETANR